jgi:hypothetical protein
MSPLTDAPVPAQAAAGLRLLAAVIEANPGGRLPWLGGPSWPVPFYAPDGIGTAEQMRAYAAEVGVYGSRLEAVVEDGRPWLVMHGRLGGPRGLHAQVWADAAARVTETPPPDAHYTEADLHRVAMAVDVTGGVPA